MKELDNLKELYLDEIRKINKKGELTPADGESAKKALEGLESIEKLCCGEDAEMERGYSEGIRRGYSNGMRSYGYSGHTMMPDMMRPYGYSYDYDGYSGYRGQSRDSMGRYSRGVMPDHMIETLEGMLQSAPSERHRDAINECIHKLRNY